MKKLLLVYVVLILAFLVYVFQYYKQEQEASSVWQGDGLRGEIGENYVMVTFLSGLEYWKSGMKGFEDAAGKLGVSMEYRGATQYDAEEQITVLEQIIAKKPAGIAISAIDTPPVRDMIDRAVDAGIPVVLFDAGVKNSKAYSFLGTNNYNAGRQAALKMAELTGGHGEIAVITQPWQQNHAERTQGFADTIKQLYPGMKLLNTFDDQGDTQVSRRITEQLLSSHPGLAGIFVTEAAGGIGAGEAVSSLQTEERPHIIAFDTDKGTLDMIKDRTIDASVAQGTWNMGYWSLQYLFHLHHGLTVPAPSSSGMVSPLPVQVDTGISIVTPENVDDYYAK